MGVAKAEDGDRSVEIAAKGQNWHEPRSLTPKERDDVLAYITANRTCTTKEAAVAAGVHRLDVKELRRVDAEFAEDYKIARGYATEEQIHQTAVKLAIEGVEEPLVSAGKLVKDDNGDVVYVRKYSERMLQTMFNSMTPEGKAAALGKLGIEISGPDGGPIKIQRGVSMDDVLAVLAKAGKIPSMLEAPQAGEIVAETDEPVED